MFTRKNQGARVDRLVRDLYFRPDVRRQFREHPDRVGDHYGVSANVVAAIADDDAEALIAHGMDRRLAENPGYRWRDRLRLMGSRLAVSVAAIVMGITMALPAGAQPKRVRARARARLRVRASGLRVAARRLGRVSIRMAKRRTASRRAVRVLRVRSKSLRARFVRLNNRRKLDAPTKWNDTDGLIDLVDPIE